MKKLFACIVLCLSGWYNSYGQLDSIVEILAPCPISPTGPISISTSPIDSATYYEWTSANGSLNSIWFNGSPGPVQTTSPNAILTSLLPQPFFVICVTAYSPCCVSNTFCDTLSSSSDSPVFAASNPSLINPGNTYLYALDSTTCQATNFQWILTGDATFGNGMQTIMNNGTPEPISFGSNFTTGTLCVVSLSIFNVFQDTVCMTITAPLGIAGNDNSLQQLFYNPGMHQLEITFSQIPPKPVHINVWDAAGRSVYATTLTALNGLHVNIPVTLLRQGIYIVSLEGTGINARNRFTVTE